MAAWQQSRTAIVDSPASAGARGNAIRPAEIGLPDETIAPDWLQRSWLRCVGHGHRWTDPVVFEPIDPGRLRGSLEASRSLIAASQPTMIHLARAVSALRHTVLVTDCAGIIVSVGGDVSRNGPALQAAARKGVDFSEACVGTTSIGGVIAEQAPLSVRGPEHYFGDMRAFNCAAAPIFGLDGSMIGVLDVSSDVVPDGPRLTRLVTAASRDIQARLFEQHCSHAFVIRMNWHPGEIGGPDDALLGLGSDGEIIAANDAARELWPRLADVSRRTLADDLFADSHGMVRAALAHGALSSQPVQLALTHGMRVWAMRSSAAAANPALSHSTAAGRAVPAPWAPGSESSKGSAWGGIGHKRSDAAERFGEYVAHRQAPTGADKSPDVRLSTIADDLIFRTVEANGGNVAATARMLGIGRSTIYRRLRYRLRNCGT